jgi:hypothetical protein
VCDEHASRDDRRDHEPHARVDHGRR